MLHVGVTGSRDGPVTPAQLCTFVNVFVDVIGQAGATLHHGDCIGWDAQCHHIARELAIDIIIHPPDKDDYRAFCEDAVFWFQPRPYLSRNRDIVAATSVLIGLPKTMHEQKRKSGTWYTIRYARDRQRKVIVILPDGTIQD